MTITVNPIVTPTFAVVSPYCVGATMSPLPTTSTNGITGVWSPALDNTVTTTYTFTPTAGQCANTTTMTVVINQLTVPTFTAIAPACEGSTLTDLPTVSLESISGFWSPALDNMNTTTYTFTPTAGQCADETTLTITINPPTVPTFTQVGPICVGNNYTLLTSSLEGITGTWSPAIDNSQTTIYTFTPDPGQCSASTLMTVAVVSATDADFTISNYCDGIGAAPVVTGLSGGVFSFNPPVSDGAVIDPVTGLISNGVVNSTYIVQYTLTGLCTVFSQELVSFVTTPLTPLVSNDTTYCLTSTFVSMTATNSGGTTNWYSDPAMTNLLGSGTNLLPLSTLGITSYYVSENLQGCLSPMDTVIITVNDCYEFTATSAFTPDGDGVNDTWVIAELNTRYPNNNVTIFNRWGQVLYNSDGYLVPWDGKYDNKDLPVGSYYYIIDFNDALDTPNATGIVTIIRN
jgi:gliding motility-associated-like protein